MSPYLTIEGIVRSRRDVIRPHVRGEVGIETGEPLITRELNTMRLLSKSVMTLGLAALMATPVMAQQRRGGGFGFGGGAGLSMLLSNPSVQEELKLDDSQKEKAREFSEKAREKRTAAREDLQGLDQEERGKKFREMAKEADESAVAAARETLKPEQLKRYYQIRLQVAGANAFEDNEYLQKKLNLTDDQKSAISSILKSSMEESREIFQNAGDDRQAAMEKLREHRKETLSKVEGKLTDEQKSQYKELLGSPFEIKYQPRGGN
jgi:hypothetical protein